MRALYNSSQNNAKAVHVIDVPVSCLKWLDGQKKDWDNPIKI
jgi:hypothetical protein